MQTLDFPALNAILNALSGVLLVIGYIFIRQRKIQQHKRMMIAAFSVSVLFLISYLIYHYQIGGGKRFPVDGRVKTVYLAILLTHTVLAALVPFLSIITLRRGLRGRYELHRRIARWTFPVWLYVNVTGVVVYWMLYQLYY